MLIKVWRLPVLQRSWKLLCSTLAYKHETFVCFRATVVPCTRCLFMIVHDVQKEAKTIRLASNNGLSKNPS